LHSFYTSQIPKHYISDEQGKFMWELLFRTGAAFIPLLFVYWYLRKLDVGEVFQHQHLVVKLICLFAVQSFYVMLGVLILEIWSFEMSSFIFAIVFVGLSFMVISNFDLILNLKFRREVPLNDLVNPDLTVGMVALVERKYTNSNVTIKSVLLLFWMALMSMFGFAFVLLFWGSSLWVGVSGYWEFWNFESVLDGIWWTFNTLTMTLVSLTLFWNGMKPVNSDTLDS
jgi:hypothetical protein